MQLRVQISTFLQLRVEGFAKIEEIGFTPFWR
jgi:hypothetical protein